MSLKWIQGSAPGRKAGMSRPASRSITSILLCVSAILTAGCSSPVSKSVRGEIDPGVSFEQLRARPESYEGKTLLLGGEILRTINRQEGTTIEVLQKRLDRWGRPRDEDDTKGRFLVFTERFLDPAVYSHGRRITVAGKVTGSQVEKIGEVDYVYPLLHEREIRLWQDRPSSVPYYPYPVWYYWGPSSLVPVYFPVFIPV